MYTKTTMQITLRGARSIIDAVLESAAGEGKEICVAVVDAGGHLVAFARTDDAELQTIHVAERKARSSALSGIPTGPTSRSGNVGSDHHLLAITLAAGVDSFVTVQGGLPIRIDGQCVGGVAVSGAAHDDGRLAAVGVAAIGAAAEPTTST